MSRSEQYNTKQKEVILQTIKNQKHEFTVKDIYHQIKEESGLTTVYRLVDKLVEEGRLRKYIGKDNNTYYELLEECNEENHFYLKCEQCGRIEHIDCDCIEELFNHIKRNHNFKPSKEHIIINGICKNCISK